MKNIISVFTDDTSYGKAAVVHAQKLAQIFDAAVNLITLYRKIDLRTVFLTEVDNTLCFVIPVGRSKKLTFFDTRNAKKWIRKSRVPVFIVGNFEPNSNDYQQVVLPLDIHCQEKELALWASYFPTYFQKNCPHIPKENLLIHIIYNHYKDEFLNKKVQNNIDFVVKMFGNLEVSYKLHPLTKVGNIHTLGLTFAKKTGNSILLYLIPEHYSLVDLIFGPVANKLLCNKENIPVLCLNPREDIFVLCQ
jgi:hypothetical protein